MSEPISPEERVQPELARSVYRNKITPDDPDDQTRDIMLMAAQSRLVAMENDASKPKAEPEPYDGSKEALQKFVGITFRKNEEAPYIGRKFLITDLIWSEEKSKFCVRCTEGGGPDREIDLDCEYFMRCYHPETEPKPEVKKTAKPKRAKTPWTDNANTSGS